MAFFEGTHHCAVYPVEDEGANHRDFRRCKKNPGHKNFMTVDEFREKDPSDIYEDDEGKTKVWNVIDRTVRVVVTGVSMSRPDTFANSKTPYPCREIRGNTNNIRYGTGFLSFQQLRVFDDGEPCTCLLCKTSQSQSPKPEVTHYFEIQTATHVVYDTQEAQKAVFEFFYDSEERSEVELLYGVKVQGDELYRCQTDRCYVLCVTHDANLAARLCELLEPNRELTFQEWKLGLFVSHPHGLSKRISTGGFRNHRFQFRHGDEIRLQRGEEVRLSGCIDAKCLSEVINLQPINDRLVTDDTTKAKYQSFRLLDDIKISFPPGVLTENDPELRTYPTSFWKKHWWRLPPGIKFTTVDGKSHSLASNLVAAKSSRMEVFVRDEFDVNHRLIELNDESAIVPRNVQCVYHSYQYTMASCPGSSGGRVIVPLMPNMPLCPRNIVHFGSVGENNISGLSKDSTSLYFHVFDENDDDICDDHDDGCTEGKEERKTEKLKTE